MTTIKTQELTGAALDWAVAKSVGREPNLLDGRIGVDGCVWMREEWSPSTEWSQGGPLMARLMDMGFEFVPDEEVGVRCSNYNLDSVPYWPNTWESERVYEAGPTPLIAACRAIVAAKLGDEVDVPEELV